MSLLPQLPSLIFSFIAVIVTFKGHPEHAPATTIPALSKFVDNELSPYIQYCSNGNSYLDSYVTSLEIEEDGYDYYDWSYDRCKTQDLRGIGNNVKKHLKQDQGIDISRYYSIVLIMPKKWPINACKLTGLAEVGKGYVWLSSNVWEEPYIYTHEIGHNYLLLHSYYNNVEYGDATSGMAGCCNQVCYSAPEKWRIGWYSPDDIIEVECGGITKSDILSIDYNKVVIISDYEIFINIRSYNKKYDNIPENLRHKLHIYKGSFEDWKASTSERLGSIKLGNNMSLSYDTNNLEIHYLDVFKVKLSCISKQKKVIKPPPNPPSPSMQPPMDPKPHKKKKGKKRKNKKSKSI